MKLHDKLIINENYFEINTAKATYVVERIGEDVVEHINAYQVKNVVYFKIVDIIMKILKNVYENSNRQRNARQKYLALKQEINQEFALFFFEFARLSHKLKYIDVMLRQDLETKINRELKSILVNNPQEFDNLS